MKRQARIAIFASGSGSNAEKLIDYFKEHESIEVALLLSNNPDAYAIKRAEKQSIPTHLFTKTDFNNTDSVVRYLQENSIDFIVLAGFLWLVPENLVSAFPARILNIHPALLPKYGGKGMYGMNVHRAVIDGAETETGISIHLVNKAYDEGAIIFQARCNVDKGDQAEDIARKVQRLEHSHFPEVVEAYILNLKR